MNIRTFTPDDYPAIIAVHESLNIIWPERPPTPQGWAEADRSRNPKCKHQRWVAQENGSVAGFASYGQSISDYHPQRFYINVEVSPRYQRRGIGSALYEWVLSGLREFEPRVLRADAFTNLPQGFAFLQKRGFYEAFRETPVHLDVAAFDPTPYVWLETRLKARGIVIKTLPELKNDPGRDRKLFDLYREADADLPREEGQVEPASFEEWLGWGLYDPSILHDAYFVAVKGDEYIGLRELGRYPQGDMLLGSLLGVRRAYRENGVGLAMQLRSIAYAREHGHTQLKTCTAIQNAPMQSMFNKLGFVRDPEWLQCQKDIVK